MKRLFHSLLWTVAALLFFLLLGFGYVWINEWTPATEEVVCSDPGAHAVLPDTLTLLTWNTGYAGLGDDMDFFMDGGKNARTSRERTAENLRAITDFLASCNVDIILLQEVDRHSRRTYHTDQFAHYQNALPDYHGYFAYNYKSSFVPVPALSPTGRVEAGVAIFSKIPAGQVVRHQYDSGFSFPVRLFNLKRCWLTAGFQCSDGLPIWIGTTHNSAYESGGMRRQEMTQLNDWLTNDASGSVRRAIVGGDWNQTPPGYAASAAETENAWFAVQPIIGADFLSYHSDTSTPSVRYLYEPLTDSTTRSVTDFFVAGFGRCIAIKTIDLGFRHSDHNPVVATFVLEK